MKKGENGGAVHTKSSIKVYVQSESMMPEGYWFSHVAVEDLASMSAKDVAVKVVKSVAHPRCR